MVVLTLCIAVCIDSLFLLAGPSEMERALTPKASASEETDALARVGATVMNIIVFELPPSESCRSSVSFDSSYFGFDFCLPVSESTTEKSETSPWFGLRGSSAVPAVAPSASMRSTRVSLPTDDSPLSVFEERIVSVATRLEPDSPLPILVRDAWACVSSERTWLAVCTGDVERFSTCMPYVVSRTSLNVGCGVPSGSWRSRIPSSTISRSERKTSYDMLSSTPVISSKMALTQRCSSPGSAAVPSIVYVLPEPWAPCINAQMLKPCSVCAIIGRTSSKTFACSAVGPYTWLNSKRRRGRRESAWSSTNTVVSSSALTATSASPSPSVGGRTRQKTRSPPVISCSCSAICLRK
mmetsp:Transcript_18707/g.41818  ORF Transcript_18707/g.41818 Transcript_18707/m.41818 type:complete len:353 (+) Transcript_18707:499-1557(+)